MDVTTTTEAARPYHPVSPLVNSVTQVRETLVDFLQQYFRRQPAPWHWHPDLHQTGVFIADAFPEVAAGTDMRPALVVERGDVVHSPTGFGNDRIHSFLGRADDRRAWGDIMTMVIHCVSSVELHAEDLQWTVRVLLGLYLDQIAEHSGLIEELEQIVLKAPQPYDPTKGGRSGKGDWHDAAVACQWRIRTSVTQENQSARLQTHVTTGVQ